MIVLVHTNLFIRSQRDKPISRTDQQIHEIIHGKKDKITLGKSEAKAKVVRQQAVSQHMLTRLIDKRLD